MLENIKHSQYQYTRTVGDNKNVFFSKYAIFNCCRMISGHFPNENIFDYFSFYPNLSQAPEFKLIKNCKI